MTKRLQHEPRSAAPVGVTLDEKMPAASRTGENKAVGILRICTEQMLSSNRTAREVLGHLRTRQDAPGGQLSASMFDRDHSKAVCACAVEL